MIIVKNRKEQYTEVVNSATELADYFFDQEGGDYTLAIVCEILEAFLQDGELPAVYVVIETACRAGDVGFPLEGDTDFGYISFHLERFAELLSEAMETRWAT